jgi:hypothetical protein
METLVRPKSERATHRAWTTLVQESDRGGGRAVKREKTD